MSELLSSVSDHLLAPGGVTIESLQGVLGDLAGPGIDAADLYFQGQISESWSLEDGIVKEGSFNLDQGVGVRAQSGEKTGFAYSNAITLEALGLAARAARSISRAGQNGTVQAFSTQDVAQLYAPDNPLEVISRAEKVELLKRVDAATRALDPRIQQVSVSMAGVWERILVASTDGGLAADVRPLVRFNVSVIVEQNGRRERGGHGGGGRTDYRYFLSEDRAMGYAREALRQALVNLVRRKGLELLPWTPELRQWQARVSLLRQLDLADKGESQWPDVSDAALLEGLEQWLQPYLGKVSRLSHFANLELAGIVHNLLPWPLPQRLDELAPHHLAVPSGSSIRLDYSEQPPILAVRLQELFGLSDTPRIAGGRQVVKLHLLSPARRPVQVTQDLANFWRSTYAEVKKDLKGRYPKHYWPDDPLIAEATARVKPRK